MKNGIEGSRNGKEILEKKFFLQEESNEFFEGKYDLMLSVLKGDFDSIYPEYRPTILDFQGINKDTKEKDILDWIEREIKISKSSINEDRKTPESKKEFNILNFAYQKGKSFLKDTLKYSENELSVGPESLLSRKDLFDLVNNSLLINGKEGLSKSILYCRLIKATVIAYETLKHDASLLKEITIGFENALVSPVSENYTTESPLVFSGGEEGKVKRFYLDDNPEIKGELTSRGKDVDKAMLRFINRPETNAESALKDGIASRISIENDQTMELLPVLCKWLTRNMGVRHLNIENKYYFSEDQMNKMKNEILPSILSSGNFNLKNESSGETSMNGFKALVIKGILSKDNVVTFTSSKNARQFEIQLVLPDNENEKGRNNHHIYDVVKLVNARTRLDGECPESIFNAFVNDAKKKSGLTREEIISYLIEPYEENGEKKEPIIIKKEKNNGKVKKFIYIANNVYSRWNQIGLIEPSIMENIKKEKNI